MNKQFIVLFFIFLFFSSCSSLKIMKQDNASIVAISATVTGVMQKGYGIEITLENINTGERFTSKPLSIASPHSVIQNIPPGQYTVHQVQIVVGNVRYWNRSSNIKAFFGVIDIKPNSKYYLGNFSGTREIGRQNILSLRINDLNIPDKLKEKIEQGDTGWRAGEFIKFYPYEKDILLIY